MQKSDAAIDMELLKACVRRRRARYVVLGIASLLLSLAGSLCFAPRSVTARMSISVAQPAEGIGMLASMTGMGASPTGKYVGALKSRQFAEAVEARAQIQKLYRIPLRDDAIERVQDGLSVNDSVRDGLIYIDLTLPAPPLLAPGGRAAGERCRQRVALAANTYGELLRDFVTTGDFDRDSLLLRSADDRVKDARAGYDRDVESLASFVVSSRLPGGRKISVEESAGAEAMGKALETLLSTRAVLQGDLQAALAGVATASRLRQAQLANLSHLPGDDPLLPQARAAVAAARGEAAALRLQYGPDHPRVLLAQDRLHVAEAELARQAASVRAGTGSDSLDAQAKIASLQAQFTTLERQIAQVEAGAIVGREFQTEFDRRKNEVMLRLEVLKAAASQAATLSVQLVAGSKRLTVIDRALPPRHATPGGLVFVLFSMLVSTTMLALQALVDYARAARNAAGRDGRESDSGLSEAA